MNREDRWYLHHFPKYCVPDVFAFKTDEPDSTQKVIVERLISYYHFLQKEFASQSRQANNDMWREIVKGYQDLEVALSAGDRSSVSSILLNICRHPSLVYGFMHYSSDYQTLLSSPFARQKEALYFIDKLVALAESLGALAVQNPEQGRWGYDHVDLAQLLTMIKARVPFDMTPPRAGGGSFGVNCSLGLLCMKDIQAIYSAVRAHGLTEGLEKKSVCEIGGGTGTLAYYLAKAGMDQISIFDLPMVSIMQGYYLMKSLGPEQVSLHGEGTRTKVRLLPFWELENEPQKSHPLLVNHDSLPEIDLKVALDYMRLIKEKGGKHFWSVNQEGQEINVGGIRQNVVANLVEQAGGFRRIYRFPHWLRAGWIEELYEVL